MPPGQIGAIRRAIESQVSRLAARQLPPIVLVSPELRQMVRQLTAESLPQLIVLSYAEITRDTRVESVALVADPSGPPAGERRAPAHRLPIRHTLFIHTFPFRRLNMKWRTNETVENNS